MATRPRFRRATPADVSPRFHHHLMNLIDPPRPRTGDLKNEQTILDTADGLVLLYSLRLQSTLPFLILVVTYIASNFNFCPGCSVDLSKPGSSHRGGGDLGAAM